ncbi:MAG: glycosyltransferase [Actinomycetota bacterium]|nr:glycosyltransferase [Actinomycetota bacterium]
MAKIAFFGMSARGHLNPIIGVLQELQEAGHELHSFGYRSTADYLDGYGIPVTCYEDVLPPGSPASPFEQDAMTVALGTSMTNPGLRREFFAALTHEAVSNVDHYRQVIADLQPDCVVHCLMFPGPRYAAQSLGVPLVTTGAMAISPKMWLGMKDPQIAAKIGADFGMLKEVTAPLQDLRRRLGLTGPPNPVDVFNVSQDLVLAYTSREFQGDYDKMRPYAFVGYVPRTARLAAPPVDPGPAPRIYVSLGTQAEPTIAAKFFGHLMAAAASMTASFVVATGDSVAPEDFTLPSNVTAARWMPQSDLMPRMDAVICHGGFSTVHEALYNAKPVWALMLDNDDFHMGGCLAASGAGLASPLGSGEVTAEQIVKNIEVMLGSPDMREAAAGMRDSLARAGGAPAARAAIERICT